MSRHMSLDLPEVYAHPLGLEQVVRNLLVNATAASEGDAEISVSAVSAKVNGVMCVEIRVSDCGRGVPQCERGRLFDPGTASRDRLFRSGLGLPIAKRLLEQCGGTIGYEPGSPKGSTFVVRLRAQGEAAG